MPQIPTMVEAGFPDVTLDAWTGFVAPPGIAPAIVSKLNALVNETLARQTGTHEKQLQIASELFVAQRAALKTLVETDVPAVERELERLGAPYTPGRIPR